MSSSMLRNSLAIGPLHIRNRVFLAPMSGVTDLPFRQQAWRSGAGLVVSEMVASQALMEGEAEMQLKIKRGSIPLHVVQLAGREAKWMMLAAKMAEANGADIVDINMGCPAKRVTTGYSGSALMRDLDHALTLIDAVVGAVEVPVTLKMRLGWDDNSINAPELAKRAEDAGIDMITVHGRTRCQFYKGHADWRKVAKVRKMTRLPLVINGDIVDQATATLALEKSGADAVMIGRGSYGAPWLPGQLAGGASDYVGLDHQMSAIHEHYEEMLAFYGLGKGVRQARKHLSWYFDRFFPGPRFNDLRRRVLTSDDPATVKRSLHEAIAAAQDVGKFKEAAERKAA